MFCSTLCSILDASESSYPDEWIAACIVNSKNHRFTGYRGFVSLQTIYRQKNKTLLFWAMTNEHIIINFVWKYFYLLSICFLWRSSDYCFKVTTPNFKYIHCSYVKWGLLCLYYGKYELHHALAAVKYLCSDLI